MLNIARYALAGTALIAGVALAAPPQAEDIAKNLINTPAVASWSVYGPGQTSKLKADKTVQGGGAMHVVIPAKPANVWDIGASTPITGAIHKGDKLVFAFWARLESGGTDGKTEIPAVVQASTAPYDPAISGSVTVTGDWALVDIKGVAPRDYAPGGANAALSLGGAAQTLDFGPAFILDMRQ